LTLSNSNLKGRDLNSSLKGEEIKVRILPVIFGKLLTKFTYSCLKLVCKKYHNIIFKKLMNGRLFDSDCLVDMFGLQRESSQWTYLGAFYIVV